MYISMARGGRSLFPSGCAAELRVSSAKAILIQDSQLSQRDRAARCVIVFAKSRRLELGDNILQTL